MRLLIVRNSITVLILFIFSVSCEKFESDCDICNYVDFYYYRDEPKQIGIMSNDFILLGYDSDMSDSDIEELIESYSYLDKKYQPIGHEAKKSKYRYTIVKLRKTSSCSRIKCIQEDLKDNKHVGYVNYATMVENCTDMLGWATDSSCVLSYGDIFYVKVKDSLNLDYLHSTVEETGTEIISQNQYRKDWFILVADKFSTGNALEMSNFFFETGLFAAAEPGFAQFEVE